MGEQMFATEYQLGAEEEESDNGNCYVFVEALMNTSDGFGQVLGGLAVQLKNLTEEAMKLERTWRQRKQQWCSNHESDPASPHGVGTAERISRAVTVKKPFKKTQNSQVPF